MRDRVRLQKPHRATRRRTLAVRGPADDVFALFCPVREADWLESWNPGPVISASGLAELECVFTTSDDNGDAVWMIAEHDPVARRIVLVKITPGFTACRLQIEVAAASATECEVSVTYSHTALSPAGEEFVAGYTEENYDVVMGTWREALDYYLEHGTPQPGT